MRLIGTKAEMIDLLRKKSEEARTRYARKTPSNAESFEQSKGAAYAYDRAADLLEMLEERKPRRKAKPKPLSKRSSEAAPLKRKRGRPRKATA